MTYSSPEEFPHSPAVQSSESLNRDRIQREVRNLILDYALGVSLLGLIPISGLLSLKLILAVLIIAKMMRDVGHRWQYPKGQDILAILGNFFGALGAIALALMAWFTFFSLGLFIPYVGSFAIAAALFTATWMVGQATHQFYASGRFRA